MGCWRDLMKDSILLHDPKSLAVLEAISRSGSRRVLTVALPGVTDCCGSSGVVTSFLGISVFVAIFLHIWVVTRDGFGECHGFAVGSKVDRTGVGLLVSEGAGARRPVAGIRG